jgi:hypothetical protein
MMTVWGEPWRTALAVTRWVVARLRPSHSTAVAAWLLLAAAVIGWSSPAAALPSFAQQTGQPCSACHVGAYGPQLKPYGRDFKLYGYVSGDGQNHLPPLAAVVTASYTQTGADRPAIRHYATNDNVAFQSLLLAYAGRIPGGAGAFVEMTYDPIRHRSALSTVDIRRAFNPTLFGKDVVLGLVLNNRPGSQDLWNSSPAFSFNSATSTFAGSPSYGPLIDGRLAQRVVGVGGYAMIANTLYLEANAYSPIANGLVGRSGGSVTASSDIYDGTAPYWRAALQHGFGRDHYVELGAYGLSAQLFPEGKRTAGVNTIRDFGVDATYQYGHGRHGFAAHATWTREDDRLDASHVLRGTLLTDHLDAFRADAIYSFDDTWTPAVQVFQTRGSQDIKYFKTANGLPDSQGYVLELAYAPWGKARSPVLWAAPRFNLRWVGYSKFNGATANASANNTLYFGARLALAPLGALVKR